MFKRLRKIENLKQRQLLKDILLGDKKTFLLQFLPKQDRESISTDVLSFVVTEVQRYFTEYKYVGKWL